MDCISLVTGADLARKPAQPLTALRTALSSSWMAAITARGFLARWAGKAIGMVLNLGRWHITGQRSH